MWSLLKLKEAIRLLRPGPPSLFALKFGEFTKTNKPEMRSIKADRNREPGAYAHEAIPILEGITSQEPNEWALWWHLGRMCDEANSLREPSQEEEPALYAKAVQAFEKAYELRPNDPRSTYELGCALRKLATRGEPKELGMTKLRVGERAGQMLLETLKNGVRSDERVYVIQEAFSLCLNVPQVEETIEGLSELAGAYADRITGQRPSPR